MEKIPKILHQIWLGPSQIPEEFVIWRNTWKELHPDWEYMLHTDDTIKDIPDNIRNFIDSCKKYSSKSNVLRLYVVFKYGGVYCDTDFEWNKNIDCFLDNKFIIAKQHGNLYCNAFFGSIPDNEVIKYQIDLLDHYVNQQPPWGPTLMTIAVKKYSNSSSDDKTHITILPTKYVYPYMWFERYKPASEFSEAYLVHHWRKSWK